jgi:hypothetical protein
LMRGMVLIVMTTPRSCKRYGTSTPDRSIGSASWDLL